MLAVYWPMSSGLTVSFTLVSLWASIISVCELNSPKSVVTVYVSSFVPVFLTVIVKSDDSFMHIVFDSGVIEAACE